MGPPHDNKILIWLLQVPSLTCKYIEDIHIVVAVVVTNIILGFVFVFQDKLPLSNRPGSPGIYFVEQDGSELTEICLPFLPK